MNIDNDNPHTPESTTHWACDARFADYNPQCCDCYPHDGCQEMEHTPLTPTIVGGMDFDQPSKNAKKKCYNCGGKGYTTQAYAFRRVEKHICLYCQITCYKCGAIKGTKKCKYKKHVWQKLLPVPRVIPNKMK